MAFDRPRRPGQQQPAGSRRVEAGAGGQGVNPGNGGGNNQPTPWLVHSAYPSGKPEISPNASFVEYLRWMRAADHPHKDGTKVQIVHLAEQDAHYLKRLEILNHRIRRMAGDGNTFEVRCLWRIRVGGTKGPESMLLPAFDAQGIPYIPSSALRGIARAQAIRHFMETEGLKWDKADRKVAQWFGHLDASGNDRMGKVTFLDAYPVPTKQGGLAADIANSIWTFTEDGQLTYKPNPNLFFSLKKTNFLIGLRPGVHCDSQTLECVREWLTEGLANGAGSQINSGYGRLVIGQEPRFENELFRVKFKLRGQLIHGEQTFTRWQLDKNGKWQHRGAPQAEVRPIAFKSTLRYWFRAFALGVLEPRIVKEWEIRLFGGLKSGSDIDGPGWIRLEVLNGNTEAEPSPQETGLQSGELILTLNAIADQTKRKALTSLFKHLTWLAFRMGGVGQGARRPNYRRGANNPPYRGSTLRFVTKDPFWGRGSKDEQHEVDNFVRHMRRYIKDFYQALGQLTGQGINPSAPKQFGNNPTSQPWEDVVDRNCRIVVCNGKPQGNKNYAIAVLHQNEFKQNRDIQGQLGKRPSAVFISNLDDYQVVTVFGSTQNPRKQFLEKLETSSDDFAQVWPMK